jgi:cyclopropane-fatty-acyl-phospholipid synthase
MFEQILTAFIKTGKLTIISANGKVVHAGDPCGDAPPPDVVLRLKGRMTAFKIAMRPDLYFGEAYMDGSIVFEQGDLWDLMDLCGRNLIHRPS